MEALAHRYHPSVFDFNGTGVYGTSLCGEGGQEDECDG